MAPEIHQLALTALTAHAFNGDRSQVAVCENTNEVKIYKKTGSGWALLEILTEHDKLVTSIDWAPKTNRIVTASQDRNAYVWTYGVDPRNPSGPAHWQPTLVLLRLNRSATFVRWSPNETKFAVASGARTVAVCQYDDESDWWIAKHLKKPIRSTVLCLDWHPNSVLIAAGSADSHARVFSAFIKGVDEKPEPTVWGDRLPFNTVCGDFPSPSGGWVHAVGFSPSGNALAFASHDSSLTVVYPSGPEQTPRAYHVVRGSTLPFVSLTFVNEYTIVAAGHDCQPVVFEGSEAGWTLSRSLDEHKGGASSAGGSPSASRVASSTGGPGRLNTEAFQHFRSADSRGVVQPGGAAGGLGAGGAGGGVGGASELAGNKAGLTTVHQNTITSVRPYAGAPEDVSQVSTSGVDGRIVIWNLGSGSVGGVTRSVGGMRV